MQRVKLTLRSWQWAFPIASVLAFVALYVVAAVLYPGGTHVHPTRVGFSLADNYWCDLLDATTYGGQPNRARPVAIAAMAVLCSGLAVLWWTSPMLFPSAQKRARITRLSGVGCAMLVPFVASPFHDMVINVAGLLGVVALTATITSMRDGDLGRDPLSVGGWGVLALLFVNYLIWQTGFAFQLLPIVQKVAFAAFLIWVVALALRLRRECGRTRTATRARRS
jgi:uncharacterized membrane protein